MAVHERSAGGRLVTRGRSLRSAARCRYPGCSRASSASERSRGSTPCADRGLRCGPLTERRLQNLKAFFGPRSHRFLQHSIFRRRRVNEPRNEPRIVTDNLTHRLEVCGNRRCPEPSGNGSLLSGRRAFWYAQEPLAGWASRGCVWTSVLIYSQNRVYMNKRDESTSPTALDNLRYRGCHVTPPRATQLERASQRVRLKEYTPASRRVME